MRKLNVSYKRIASMRIALLCSVMLILQTISVAAATGISGDAIRLSPLLQTNEIIDYDTYEVDGIEYTCYIGNDVNLRYYYDEKHDLLITDPSLLRKLEVVYSVSSQDKGFFGLFTNSTLHNQIKETRTIFEKNYNTLKSKYENFELLNQLAYAATSLGSSGVDDNETTTSQIKSLAQSILIDYLQSTQENALRNEKLKKYATNMIHSAIFTTFENSIYHLKAAESLYSDFSKDELKDYDNAMLIYEKYEFSLIAFTQAWNYVEKEMMPDISSKTEPLNQLGYIMNYALLGTVGIDPDMMFAESNDASYPLHQGLIDYINNNNIGEESMVNVFNFAVMQYNASLTPQEIEILRLLGKIDPYFGELTMNMNLIKNRLMSDIPRTAFQSLYAIIGKYQEYRQNSWSEESSRLLVNNGILDEEAIYPYQESISREAFCEMAYQLYVNQKGEVGTFSDKFIDTDNQSVLKLNTLGIINGKSENQFEPTQFITREEVAVIVSKLADKMGITTSLSNPITFVDESSISTWAKEYVRKAASLGVIKGNDKREFLPKNKITIEQTMVVLGNFLQQQQSKTDVMNFSGIKNVKDDFLRDNPKYSNMNYYWLGYDPYTNGYPIGTSTHHYFTTYSYPDFTISFVDDTMTDSSDNGSFFDMEITAPCEYVVDGYGVGDKIDYSKANEIESKYEYQYELSIRFSIDYQGIIYKIEILNSKVRNQVDAG